MSFLGHNINDFAADLVCILDSLSMIKGPTSHDITVQLFNLDALALGQNRQMSFSLARSADLNSFEVFTFRNAFDILEIDNDAKCGIESQSEQLISQFLAQKIVVLETLGHESISGDALWVHVL
jgi:hypothetical protein